MNRFLKTSLLATALALGAGFAAAPAFAYDEASPAAINVDAGVILHGHDAVAYQTENRPVKGNAAFSATHEGATYHFVSAANRDAFLADPARYAPAYGGFCAMGAALEKKLDIDPTQFKVVDGRLYLNVNADVFTAWEKDIPTNIKNANQNWPGIKDTAPNAL
ncbi:YHS domain-containing (seleno)protein [Silanimonas sp.]|uniref:YHS domain-containing (seleno)protein n=1 Tax=Silanimonas sp. TaxID=1929290 RepID=UPI0022BC503E|nr:YHS domain-containing (seleno)protein [Silanimonas sp.]MCZ8165652.1 YHS domain-containing (seleno)protein [Silanimonas sp.]